jgi:NADH dehydrogenase
MTKDEVSTKQKHPRVVIIGAGFAGLWAARALARKPVDVRLVDRNNYHTFLPLLYQVAAAELQPGDIAYPIRSILRRWPNVHFEMDEVQGINFATRTVDTAHGPIAFDYLILGAGSAPHFFGVPGAAEHAFSLKRISSATTLRNHILRCFERASREVDAARRQQLLTFVVVGCGPTGIEYAGALSELVHGPLAKDFRALNFDDVRITILEARDCAVPGMPERVNGYVLNRLKKMKVEVRTQTSVTRVTPETVELQDGTAIRTETVVWTAGVQGIPEARIWGLPTARNGQVTVLPTLQVPEHPEVYVAGDLASVANSGHSMPMVAPVAMQQGVSAAQNILRQIGGRELKIFRYRNPGMMVTIGRHAAAVYVRGLLFTGFVAWMLWLGVHVAKLIGFRNRMLVLINWAWEYCFYGPAIRIILPSEAPEASPSVEPSTPAKSS